MSEKEFICTDGGNCNVCGRCLAGSQDGPIRSIGAEQTIAEYRAVKAAAKYHVAVDIGTTTIAMALVDTAGNICLALTKNNRQRAFGADVLSRIRYAISGGAAELQDCIWQDLMDGVAALTQGTTEIEIGQIIISANTTMEHLLLGDSCETLGVAPFIPADLSLREYRLKELVQAVPAACTETMLVILPGISAFIGADIVAGMYACGMASGGKMPTHSNILFVDLGTNGEMVLQTSDGFLATSVAAGPAFEGGNITHGCPSIDGAICSVSLLGERIITQTIGNRPPVGLCGTAVAELAYEMVKTGKSDVTGNFVGECHTQGLTVAQTEDGEQIVFTQSDMRQLQMAKAAVRAGIEILLAERGLTAGDVDTVYLAGGFGYRMNIYKAVEIGLLPKALREKTKALGNTSLQGAIRYLGEKNAASHLMEMIAASSEINLAKHPAFEENYLHFMNF